MSFTRHRESFTRERERELHRKEEVADEASCRWSIGCRDETKARNKEVWTHSAPKLQQPD